VSPWYAYETIIKEALLVDGGLTRTLQKTAPLILTGLAVVIPLRVGLFNIGGQGQLIFGAMPVPGSRMPRAWPGSSALIIGILAGGAGAAMGLDRRCPQGLARGARGHHDDHAQLHRAGITWWLVTGPLQGSLQEHQQIPQTELDRQRGPRRCRSPASPSASSSPPRWRSLCWWMLRARRSASASTPSGRTSTPPAMPASRSTGSSLLSMVFAGGLAGLAGALEVHGHAPLRAGHRRHPWASTASPSPCWPGQPDLDDPGRLARRHPAHRRRRPAVRHRHRARDRRPAPRDHPALVSIPVLGKWIFRSRADKVQPPRRAGGTDMAWISATTARSSCPSPSSSLAYAFYFLTRTTSPRCTLAWTYAVPLVLAALVGVIGERSGVVNIGIEGQMLVAAFAGFFGAAYSGSLIVGVLSGIGSGLILGGFLAWTTVKWRMDQIIAGVVLNIVATGITSFYYKPGQLLPGP
jgi:ABC-type uncharacterized transport system permease subunit